MSARCLHLIFHVKGELLPKIHLELPVGGGEANSIFMPLPSLGMDPRAEGGRGKEHIFRRHKLPTMKKLSIERRSN